MASVLANGSRLSMMLALVTSLCLTEACIVAEQQARDDFLDQDFKTVLALVELHKVRTGLYPQALQDMEYLGLWDRKSIIFTRYVTNDARTAYFFQPMQPGSWRPDYPDSFWQGTGYDVTLRPSDWQKLQ